MAAKTVSRRRWSNSREYLMSNITDEEFDDLERRGVHVRDACAATMTKGVVRKLRTTLRKVRNVASARRHRAAQLVTVGKLQQTVADRDAKVAALMAENARLRACFARVIR